MQFRSRFLLTDNRKASIQQLDLTFQDRDIDHVNDDFATALKDTKELLHHMAPGPGAENALCSFTAENLNDIAL
jgi:hypothetical protein